MVPLEARKAFMSESKAFDTSHSFGTGVAQSLANLRSIFCVSLHCLCFFRFHCLSNAAATTTVAVAVNAAATTTSFLIFIVSPIPICAHQSPTCKIILALLYVYFSPGDMLVRNNRNRNLCSEERVLWRGGNKMH